MLATITSAALALLSPLIGFTYKDGYGGWPRSSSPTIVDPRTLKPLDDAPKLPRGASHFERSPDGSRIAALDGDDLVMASTRTGRSLGRIRVGSVEHDPLHPPVLSWIAPRTILVIDRYEEADRPVTRVRTVSTSSRTVVGDPLRFVGGFMTSRVAGRQLILIHPELGPLEAQGPVPVAVVLDGEGRVAHRTELADLARVGSLDRNLISGNERWTGQYMVQRFDLRTGTVAVRRRFANRGDVLPPHWELPGPHRAAWLTCDCDEEGPLDRTDLTPLLPRKEYPGTIDHTAPDGLLVRNGPRGHPARFHLTARELDGTWRWRRWAYWGANVAAIGRYVYIPHVHDDGTPFTDVVRLRDGRRVAHVRGFRELFRPSDGRSVEQVPRLDAFFHEG